MTGGDRGNQRRASRAVISPRLIVGIVGVVMAGSGPRPRPTSTRTSSRSSTGCRSNLEGLANALAALGSIWCVLAIVVVLLVARWFPAARDAAIAGGVAWLIAHGLNELLGTRSASGARHRRADRQRSVVPGRRAPRSRPRSSSRSRRTWSGRCGRLAFVLVVLVALAGDVPRHRPRVGRGRRAVPRARGRRARCTSLFGAPSGRPTAAQIHDRGRRARPRGRPACAVVRLEYPGATIMDGALGDGRPVRVVAFGRDQRDGQVAAKLWHNVMYKDPGMPVFGSRLQTVEHLAYAAMVAEQGGVDAPRRPEDRARPDRTSRSLVTDVPSGPPARRPRRRR